MRHVGESASDAREGAKCRFREDLRETAADFTGILDTDSPAGGPRSGRIVQDEPSSRSPAAGD
jgi:hypothetical protein